MTAYEISVEVEAWNKRHDWNNYLIGTLCAVTAEPHRDKKKRPQAFGPYDFVPRPKAEGKKEQTWQDMLMVCEVLTAVLGGTDER